MIFLNDRNLSNLQGEEITFCIQKEFQKTDREIDKIKTYFVLYVKRETSTWEAVSQGRAML